MDVTPRVRELARAKVNLALHVVGRRPDGYHLLESLVAFPSIGDTVTVAPAPDLTFEVAGPFAAQAPHGPDNLVLRARELLGDATGERSPDGDRIELHKSLPVASGIGGGSADAAATLRALARMWNLNYSTQDLARIGSSLGADVAMCVVQKPLIARGIGDELTLLGAFPEAGLVLVNPGMAVSTPEVFARLEKRDNAPLPPPPPSFGTFDALVGYLTGTRNDLEPAARGLTPEIDRVSAALETTPGCRFTRMSGSGATCFGLFESSVEAQSAAEALRMAFPQWWIEAGPL